MNMTKLVSSAMFDVIPLAQLLTTYVHRKYDVTERVRLAPSDRDQRPFLEWYGENWRQANQVRVKGEAGNEQSVNRFLELNARGTKLDRVVADGLLVASVANLSDGWGTGTETPVIGADGHFYKGTRFGMKGLRLFEVRGIPLPLVKLSHTATADLWVAATPKSMAPNPRELDLFQFATHTMKNKKEIYKPADKYAYVEIPEVDVTVRRRLDWMQGLVLNDEIVQQVMQVCRLQLKLSNWAKGYSNMQPIIASETLTGLEPICFDRDFIIWVSHREHVSPVIHVPTSIWTKA